MYIISGQRQLREGEHGGSESHMLKGPHHKMVDSYCQPGADLCFPPLDISMGEV